MSNIRIFESPNEMNTPTGQIGVRTCNEDTNPVPESNKQPLENQPVRLKGNKFDFVGIIQKIHTFEESRKSPQKETEETGSLESESEIPEIGNGLEVLTT